MPNRRQILGAGFGLPVVLAAGPTRARALERLREARPAVEFDDPAAAARDEDFWAWVRDCYTIDTSIVNFNNGGVSPATADAQAAQKRFMDQTHRAPAYHLWRLLESQRETVRTRLARYHAVSAEEVALTRNASESLMALLFGHDLRRGDEVLCTTHDYPRMLETLRQRERREGIRLVTFEPPVPLTDPGALYREYAARITDRTKLILVSHMVYLTGQVFPVAEIARSAVPRASRSSSMAPTRSSTSISASRTWTSTSTERRSTSGSAVRSARGCCTCGGNGSSRSGRCSRRTRYSTTTSASSSRSARTPRTRPWA